VRVGARERVGSRFVWSNGADLARANALALLAALVLALVFASSAGAEEATQITGQVTSAVTKAPLADITVCTERMGGTGPWICATTNAGGEYSVQLVSGGNYHIEFKVPPPSSYVARTFYDGTFSFSEAVVVHVPEGGTTSGIDAELREGGYIKGAVTSAATKAGLEGLQVCAREPEHPRNLDLPEKNSGCAKTNASGEYSIEGLATGEYEVEFALVLPSEFNDFNQFYDDKSSWPEADLVSVTAGNTISGIDAELESGGQITGTLMNAATKAPIEGADVCAGGQAEDGYENHCAKTNEKGEYVIPRLRSGKFWVQFAATGYVSEYLGGQFKFSEAKESVSVTTGDVTPGVDMELDELPRVGGTVTSISTKAPIEGAEVCVRLVSSTSNGPCANTDAHGEYLISGLEVGEYTIEFNAHGLNYLTQFYDGAIFSYDATRIAAAPGTDATGVDAELEEPGTIEGKVTSASTKAPIEGVYVCAGEPPEGNRICDTTNARGEYTISGLPGRAYYVEFNAGDVNYLTQFYAGKYSRAEAQPVSIVSGATVSGADAELVKINGGGLTGTVLSAETERPISGLEVCAYEAGGEGLVGACAKTESRGEYTITGLMAGAQYVVEFSSPIESGLNYITQFYNGKSSASEANVIGITAGSLDPSIDARLKAGGRIAGKVVDAASKATVAGIEVCAFATQSESVGCAITGPTGEYVIAGLAHGAYLVEFSSPTKGGLDYVTQYYGDESPPSEADTVSVEEGATQSGIDAELQEGGRVEGRVTNLSTGAPMKDVLVCALVSVREAAGCGVTGPSGEYTTLVVPGGAYKVGFDAGEGYSVQYYNDKPSFAAAQTVSIAARHTAAGVDAAMSSGPPAPVHAPPMNTKAPVIFGEPVVGETLSCANGLWTGSPTPTFTQQWLRNGTSIAGATGRSYQVQDADEGASLTCVVTAKSTAGEAGAMSAAIVIPESSSTIGTPVSSLATTPLTGARTAPLPPVAVEGSRVAVSGSSMSVHLKCAAATSCRGSVELIVEVPSGRHGRAKTMSPRQQTLVLAKGSFSLAEGGSATVLLHLTTAGKRRLAHAQRHPIPASLVVSVQGAKTTTTQVRAR
jgi:hypothetical protein